VDTVLRLGCFFNMFAEYWLGLQMDDEQDTESDRLTRFMHEAPTAEPKLPSSRASSRFATRYF